MDNDFDNCPLKNQTDMCPMAVNHKFNWSEKCALKGSRTQHNRTGHWGNAWRVGAMYNTLDLSSDTSRTCFGPRILTGMVQVEQQLVICCWQWKWCAHGTSILLQTRCPLSMKAQMKIPLLPQLQVHCSICNPHQRGAHIQDCFVKEYI